MKRSLAQLGLGLLFALGLSGAVSAGVPKVVWIEEFGATW